MKNKNIVCIFAHPDDEAFGPSGTIAKWGVDNDVYIICVTDGSNPLTKNNKLKKIRKKELLSSAKILGVKRVYFLEYTDGELRNNVYHEVSDKIEKILSELKPRRLLTYEPKGVSGHIDHIFVSMVSSYIFQKMKFIRELFYFVGTKYESNLEKDYFIYFPDGYERNEVDYVEDISDYWNNKVKSIKAHVSQNEDGKYILHIISKLPKEELFFIKEK